MDKKKAQHRIKVLTNQIRKYDDDYYIKNNPVISDLEYNQLRRKLKQLEEKYPQYILPDSPSKRVGTPLKNTIESATISYIIPMLSITDAWSVEELLNFDKTRKKLLDVPTLSYMCEPKYDGLSCSLLYEKGILKQGSTRGDGYEGEDVSKNVKVIKNIPLKLNGNNPPELVEVRGEVILFKEDFKKLNQQQELNKRPLFANPRNAAAGSLRQLNPTITASRKLHFFGWGIGLHKGWFPKTQNEILNQLIQWGFTVDSHRKICKTMEEAVIFYNEITKIRDDLLFDIDGIVIKINRYDFREKLGNTAHAPRWSIAYKFEAKRVTTRVKDIISQVGRTGVVTPVAILEPVKFGGVLIKRATLHTFSILKNKDIRIGDRVIIERAGDVIPEVIAPITSIRKGKEKPFHRPKNCPSCGSTLKPRGAYWVCENIACPAQLLGRTKHLVSKQAFNIKGLGASNIELLIKHNLINNPADIFKLTENNLIKLPKWGAKKTVNLLNEINLRKKITLPKFINALSIRGVGINTAKLLAKHFGNLDKLKQADITDLKQIQCIGQNVAIAIFDFFKDKFNLLFIKKMLDAGVIIQNKEE